MAKEANDTRFILGTNAVRHILLWGGLFLFIIGYTLAKILPDPTTVTYPLLVDVGIIVFALIKFTGSVCFATGFLSLIMEISTIKNVVINTVRETYESFINKMLKEQVYLERYSKKELQRLHDNIIIQKNSDLDLTEKILKKSVYCLEPEINNLIAAPYYEYYNDYVHITPKNSEHLFHKNVISKFKVVNPYIQENNIVRRQVSLLSPLIGQNVGPLIGQNEKDRAGEILKFNQIKIDGEDFTEKIKDILKCEFLDSKNTYKLYQYCVKFEVDIGERKMYTVNMDYEYDVLIEDNSQSFKLSKPCKRFHHQVQLIGNNAGSWEIGLNGFASFYTPDSELKQYFSTSEFRRDYGEVKFDYWVLPGSGCVAVFRKMN